MHGVTPLQATLFLVVPLVVYVLAVWLQWLWATRTPHRQGMITLVCLSCFALVAAAVAWGLPLPWALPLLCIGPVIVIIYNERGRKHCGEFFKVL